MQLSHIAQVALCLRLLGTFGPNGERIELISSILHYRKKQIMPPYLPNVSTDVNELVNPTARDDPNKLGRGYTACSNVNLMSNTVWTHSLNLHQ